MDVKNKIAECLKCDTSEITCITDMKVGMTNKSYSFTLKGKKYIFRTPGKGAAELVDRQHEYEAYKAIRWLNISDKVVYYDKNTGIKISEYIENAKTCDAYNIIQIMKCLQFAKHNLHDANKIVKPKIDIIEMINDYEKLMGKSKYDDYDEIKSIIVKKLKSYKKKPHKYCLCHFDLNPDNFLIAKNGQIYLLDWEYAGMNDPLFDVAGWIVYSKYDESQIHDIIASYFEHEPTNEELDKMYVYIAAMGLLWSNWCEYKRKCGQEFGDYAEQQYEYARKYSIKSAQ